MPPRILPLLIASLLAGATALHSATIVRPPIIVPFPPARHLGVTVSLTTGGYEFDVNETAPAAGTDTTTPGFIASFELINHSRTPISFQIPQVPPTTGAAAAPVATVLFTVYDKDANAVWTSSTEPAGAVPQETVLKAGGVWRLTTQVPLQVNGAWLDGDYTLVAAVNGAPAFSATAPFKVAKAGPMVGDDVQGQVLSGPVFPVSKIGWPNEHPVAGAIVQYQNAATPDAPFQKVIADDQGRFSFNVPAGTYTVTATIPGDEGTPFGQGQQTITVDGVTVTQVTFHLDTGIRVPIRPFPPIGPIGPIVPIHPILPGGTMTPLVK